MASEPETDSRKQLVDDIKTLIDDLETELETEMAAGRGRLADLTAEFRSRLDELRGKEEPEPERTAMEKLQDRFDELAEEVDAELEEGRTRVMEIVDELDDRLARLESRIRPD